MLPASQNVAVMNSYGTLFRIQCQSLDFMQFVIEAGYADSLLKVLVYYIENTASS